MKVQPAGVAPTRSIAEQPGLEVGLTPWRLDWAGWRCRWDVASLAGWPGLWSVGVFAVAVIIRVLSVSHACPEIYGLLCLTRQMACNGIQIWQTSAEPRRGIDNHTFPNLSGGLDMVAGGEVTILAERIKLSAIAAMANH